MKEYENYDQSDQYPNARAAAEDISQPGEPEGGEQTYVVTYVRYGFVQVTASSPEEAERIADGYADEDIPWSDNYEQVSIEKTEDY